VVTEYLRRGEKVAVIIDSLEYIMENNSADKVLMMLYNLRDEIVLSDSTLILSIDPDTMEESHMALLEREFETVSS
jgi:archaellum biogenesis ATPase FlaH